LQYILKKSPEITRFACKKKKKKLFSLKNLRIQKKIRTFARFFDIPVTLARTYAVIGNVPESRSSTGLAALPCGRKTEETIVEKLTTHSVCLK